jgi:4-diphosphocytidyl-2-C-methyl-D-erythritol kinase
MLTFPNAKINLGLQILRKRNDGFHEIETCLYPIPLQDSVEIIEAEDDEFKSTGIPISGEIGDNLCMKALFLLRQDFDIPPVYIHLHKVIPHGAGLGGGSSDAVAIIQSLNKMFDLKIDNGLMHNFASRLGSDCAFFVNNKPAIGSGRGEVLRECQVDLKGKHIVLVYPDFGISSGMAYSLIDPQIPEKKLEDILKLDIRNWKDILINDFQDVLEDKYDDLRSIRLKLYQKGSIFASMSGSGSAYFGIFDEEIKDAHTWFPDNYFVRSGILNY